LLRTKEHNDGKYNLSGVYQLQCAYYQRKYIGQTERTFKIRFKENLRDIKNNGQNTNFAQHILDTKHEYETIGKTMKILHVEKKGQMLDTYGIFHIYEISKQNMQLNYNFAEIYNPIYDTTVTAYQNIGNAKQPD
jgi:hypothetical protein